MHLDGYCRDLNLAFEYNGRQHYERVAYWQSDSDFQNQIKRDTLKDRLCEENSVHLIRISHSEKDIESHIRRQLSKLDIAYKKDPIDWTSFRKNQALDEYKRIAEEKGGKLLSRGYFGTRIKLEWECSKNHQWQAAPRDIKRGHWCRKCGWERAADTRRKKRLVENAL